MSCLPVRALGPASPSTQRRMGFLAMLLALALVATGSSLRASGRPAPETPVGAAPALPTAESLLINEIFMNEQIITAFTQVQVAYAQLINAGIYESPEDDGIEEEPTITVARQAALSESLAAAQASLGAHRQAWIQGGGPAGAFAPLAAEVLASLEDWLDGVVRDGIDTWVNPDEDAEIQAVTA